jgi:acyl dehydratase
MSQRCNDGFGRYFEDFEMDKMYEHWPGKTITKFDNHMFCLLTMNHHPVHLDEKYASKQQHGEILVVGPLVISLVVGMSVRDVSGKAIANLEYETITHDNPVFVGDTIYAASHVLNKRISESDSSRGIVTVETNAFNQDDEQVLSLKRKFLVPRSPS